MFIYTYLQLFECTIICIYLFVQSVFDKYIVLYSVTKDAQDPVNFPHASSGSCMSTPVLIQKLPTGSAYQGTSNRKEWNHWRTNANFEPPSDNHDNQFKLHFTCATLKLWFWHNQSHTIHVYPCMVYLPTWKVDFYGFQLGKYTSPMDASWKCFLAVRNHHCVFIPVCWFPSWHLALNFYTTQKIPFKMRIHHWNLSCSVQV